MNVLERGWNLSWIPNSAFRAGFKAGVPIIDSVLEYILYVERKAIDAGVMMTLLCSGNTDALLFTAGPSAAIITNDETQVAKTLSAATTVLLLIHLFPLGPYFRSRQYFAHAT